MANYRTFFKNYYHLSLDKNIHVHHIDHNRENNSIENLVAIPSELHQKYHAFMNEAEWVIEYLGGFHSFFFELDQRFWIDGKKMFVIMQEYYELMQPWRKIKAQFDEAIDYSKKRNLPLWNNLNLSYKIENGIYLPSLSFIGESQITDSFEILLASGMTVL